MGKLTVFNFMTLNGYFKGVNGDLSWHKHGPQENEFSAEMIQKRNTLLFGRVTYEMMKSYWPTDMAIKNDPIVANGMNAAEKIVFSKTLKTADWKNTGIISENIVEEVKKLKKSGSKDMTLLGSGSILTLFAENNLIDEYQIMVDPVVIGNGTTMMNGIKSNLELTLTKSLTFKSGVIVLYYQPK